MPFDGTKLEARLPRSAQKTIANLQKVRAYLDEHRWVKKVAIVYRDGDCRRWPPLVPLRRKEVEAVCALGAIYLAVPLFQRKAVMQALWATIAKRYGVMSIHKFNDRHEKPEVLQLFDAAVDDLYEDALRK